MYNEHQLLMKCVVQVTIPQERFVRSYPHTLFTPSYTSLHLFTPLYNSLRLFTPLYNSLHLFTPLYTSLHLFTPLHIY